MKDVIASMLSDWFGPLNAIHYPKCYKDKLHLVSGR
jgi:hypothetical protein